MATQVGEAIIKLTFDGKDLKASLNGIESDVESSGSSTGKSWGSAWSVAAGSLVSKGISKIAGAISNNLGRAINRVDTIKNFPKVMTALGYSSEEASESINTISESLDGLPTTMDAAVGDIQKLAATMGNLSKGTVNATTVGLALNNMFLASGKGTEKASAAMEQYNQMLAAGKPDMQSWRTMLDVAPGQLKQLAQTLIGATADSHDLYKALQEGTVSFEQMNEAIVKLNNEGGDGFASFEEQARAATGGLGTALENLQTRIAKAIAKIIDHLDSEKIAKIINDFSSHLSDLADVVINIIDFLIDNQWILGVVAAFFASKVVIDGISKITKGIQGLTKSVGGLFSNNALGGLSQKLQTLFTNLTNVLTNILSNLKNVLVKLVEAIVEPVKVALKGIGEAIAGFFTALADPAILLGAINFIAIAGAIALAILMIGSALGVVMPALTDLFNNIIQPIAEFIRDTVIEIINTLTDTIIRLTQDAIIPLGEFLVNSFVTILESLTNVITNLTQNAVVPLINTLSGAFSTVVNSIADLITGVLNAALQGIAEIVRAVGDGFLKMGEAIKMALEGVQGVLSVFADLIKSIASAAVAIVAMVTGHSINYGSGYAHLFAEGGRVIGPGTSTSDSIPAFLSNGEYVIQAKSAKAIGYDNLDILNENPRDWSTGIFSDASSSFSENDIGGKIVNVYMTNEINSKLDAEEIGQIMMESIRRAA